jgi:hypothetical protein
MLDMEKDNSLEETEKIEIPSVTDENLEGSVTEEQRWAKIMERDFNETSINYEFRVDMRFDNYFTYECSKHVPCVYFRVGEGDDGFFPMIISDTPYVPYPFERTISEEDLCWVSRFVRTNKSLLLEYADGKYGYREFMSLVDRCDGIPERATVSSPDGNLPNDC